MCTKRLIVSVFCLGLSLLLAFLITGYVAAQAGSSGGPRIINGEPTDITEVPWQVAVVSAYLENDGEAQSCGASILSADWVISAAHCFVFDSSEYPDSEASDIEIVAGITNLGVDVSPRIKVSKLITHPDYDPVSTKNDIALLKLATPISLNGSTKEAIALPFS